MNSRVLFKELDVTGDTYTSKTITKDVLDKLTYKTYTSGANIATGDTVNFGLLYKDNEDPKRLTLNIIAYRSDEYNTLYVDAITGETRNNTRIKLPIKLKIKK